MGIVPLPKTTEELDGFSEQEVMARYNKVATASSSYEREELFFWRTEWEYRLQRRVAATIERLTCVMTGLTVVVAICTVVMMAFTVLLYLH